MITDGLAVQDLTVRFGGLVAVDGISLAIPRGRLTGLIGPNGAGKTTTFNACTGLTRQASGSVHLFGKDISRAAPHARARMGVGRTFQRMELFEPLSVEQNVYVACEARRTGSRRLGSLSGTKSERREIGEACDAMLQRCHLDDLRDRRASALSTGHRRLLELARVLAAGFPILLLDEPSSGLDTRETEMFGQILADVVAEDDLGVLLVEHDMLLVTNICSHLYVLDFGRLIASGETAEVINSDTVRRAYLGTATPA